MTEKIMGVYVIKCIPNGLCYVGSSTNIQKRWAEHRNLISKKKHYNKALREASKKYSIDDFSFIIVEPTLHEHELADREKYYINLLGVKCGVFNVSTNTKHHSKEVRQRLSKSVSGGNNHNAKKVMCIETGEIFSCAEIPAQKYGTDASHIAKVCRGVRPKAGGKRWIYITNPTKIYQQTKLF